MPCHALCHFCPRRSRSLFKCSKRSEITLLFSTRVECLSVASDVSTSSSWTVEYNYFFNLKDAVIELTTWATILFMFVNDGLSISKPVKLKVNNRSFFEAKHENWAGMWIYNENLK